MKRSPPIIRLARGIPIPDPRRGRPATDDSVLIAQAKEGVPLSHSVGRGTVLHVSDFGIIISLGTVGLNFSELP